MGSLLSLATLIKMSSLGAWEWTREGEEDSVGASVVWSSFLAIIRCKQDFNVAISRSLPIKPTDSMSNLMIGISSKLLSLIRRIVDRLIIFDSDFLVGLRDEPLDRKDPEAEVTEDTALDPSSYSTKLPRGLV